MINLGGIHDDEAKRAKAAHTGHKASEATMDYLAYHEQKAKEWYTKAKATNKAKAATNKAKATNNEANEASKTKATAFDGHTKEAARPAAPPRAPLTPPHTPQHP